ncbi:hypothetical protein BBJ29_004642 [Phytophthora kernoviae]|uniref:Uncharacterized protein n=1 Tax=Phytophthora kernoviae TaxID=325452 RepID=A0A3F2S4K5_9STRA|nr:hypothetical protein BBJ29_004642 [Phytophthora kernoviae]RLN70005.1 hypothetical protein BBP00_00000009 [Phytophthora kernoviae]
MSVPLQRRGGRVPGAEGYHKEDTRALLASVKRVVPTTLEEWDQVLAVYRDSHAIPNDRAKRDANSLKCKFKQLAKMNEAKPEGREAHEIMTMIDAKLTDGKWPQRRGGRARGAEGFSPQDSQAVLDCVRRILPVYREDWEHTAEEYYNTYAALNDRVRRDGVSLKNKFRQWLKSEDYEMEGVPRHDPRPEVTQAREIQLEITAKIDQSRVKSQVETDVRVNEGTPSESKSVDEDEYISGETEEAKQPLAGHRRGGRPPGSEGYTRSDTNALLSCIKQILPAGPSGWDQVLHLYRATHTTPNSRSARAIQMDIELSMKLGKNSESGSPFVHIPIAAGPATAAITASTPAANNHDQLQPESPHPEFRNNENLERQNVASELATGWSLSPQVSSAESLGKRQRNHDDAGAAANVKSPTKDFASEVLRSEIASRELELLKQREQREAEQAAWEKDRAKREKQRMDMDAWTSVCDRLRTLFREQATEQNPEIAGDIAEEIQLLKKKKQRLADLL